MSTFKSSFASNIAFLPLCTFRPNQGLNDYTVVTFPPGCGFLRLDQPGQARKRTHPFPVHMAKAALEIGEASGYHPA